MFNYEKVTSVVQKKSMVMVEHAGGQEFLPPTPESPGLHDVINAFLNPILEHIPFMTDKNLGDIRYLYLFIFIILLLLAYFTYENYKRNQEDKDLPDQYEPQTDVSLSFHEDSVVRRTPNDSFNL